MYHHILRFLRSESGAVTVDWTTLSAAAVGMALATAAMLTGTINMVNSRLDGELRQQQLSDGFVRFTSAHFEPLYEKGLLDPAVAEQLFEVANNLFNQDILNGLQAGLEAVQAGTLPKEELAALIALASVAHQRNLVSDEFMNHYFGFDGRTGAIAGAL